MKRLNEYIHESHKFLVTTKPKPTNYKYFPKTYDELDELINLRISNEGLGCDLNDIDTSEIIDMSYLFSAYKYPGRQNFHGDISRWNISNVKRVEEMFYKSNFNGDISSWDTGNIDNFRFMFMGSSFDQDISNWDVHNAQTMSRMFYDSKFTQDISSWRIPASCSCKGMFDNCKLIYEPKKWPKGLTQKRIKLI